jgi:hypothetical protein
MEQNEKTNEKIRASFNIEGVVAVTKQDFVDLQTSLVGTMQSMFTEWSEATAVEAASAAAQWQCGMGAVELE